MKPLLFLLGFSLFFEDALSQRRLCSTNNGSTEGSLRENYQLFSTSGNLQIDQATIRELQILQQAFLVSPVFFFYDDIDGKNAQATDEVLNPVNGPDGTVVFGRRLFNREFVRSYGGTTIPIIIAHEYAHIVDMRYGVLEHVSSKQRELFADVFAGMYIAVRGAYGLYTDLDAVQNTFLALGDTDFGSETHHGTPAERVAAVQYGYNYITGRTQRGLPTPLTIAIDAAKAYVEQFEEEGW